MMVDDLPQTLPDTAAFEELLQSGKIINAEVIPLTPEEPEVLVSEVTRNASAQRVAIVQHYPDLIDSLPMPKRQREKTLRLGAAKHQHYAAIVQAGLDAGKDETDHTSLGALPPLEVSESHQLTIEDILGTLDFVEIPDGVVLETYERALTLENHVSQTMLTRLARAVTEQGMEFPRYDETAQDDTDQAEADAMREWLDNVNLITPWRTLVATTVAQRKPLGNAYWEVMRDGTSGTPSGLDGIIASTVRVLLGHRGFAQWVNGEFRYYNNYTWLKADRDEGTALWEQYWRDRNLDPRSDEFIQSPWSRILSSHMPRGTWNPYLTEIVHFKEYSLTSKYYGQISAVATGKLHALIYWAMSYNVALQQNSNVPPYVAVYHGELDADTRAVVHGFLRSLRGANAFGSTLLLEVADPLNPPAAGVIPRSGHIPAGLEFVQVAGNAKEGIFLELIDKLVRHWAFWADVPFDLIETTNSNRATIDAADYLFQRFGYGPYMQDMEDVLKRIFYYDMGLTRRYARFKRMDATDKLQMAQYLQILDAMGELAPGEARSEFGMPPISPVQQAQMDAQNAASIAAQQQAMGNPSSEQGVIDSEHDGAPINPSSNGSSNGHNVTDAKEAARQMSGETHGDGKTLPGKPK